MEYGLGYRDLSNLIKTAALLCGGFFCPKPNKFESARDLWTFHPKYFLSDGKILDFFYCNLSVSMVH